MNNSDKSAVEQNVKNWLEKFTECVRKVDFDAGQEMFHPDAFCFGSVTEVAFNRKDLTENQWKVVWPNIIDFSFDLDHLHITVGENLDMACAMCPWVSTGFNEDGSSFDRPGRVTILLMKNPESGEWLAHHSHYSLKPGTPAVTKKKQP